MCYFCIALGDRLIGEVQSMADDKQRLNFNVNLIDIKRVAEYNIYKFI